MSDKYIQPTESNLSKVLQALIVSSKSKRATNNQNKKGLPMVTEVLQQLMKTGTVFVYPEGEIDFKNCPLSPIKKLTVNTCSTETNDMQLLHKLHNQTRQG